MVKLYPAAVQVAADEHRVPAGADKSVYSKEFPKVPSARMQGCGWELSGEEQRVATPPFGALVMANVPVYPEGP
jgi:hypothetical protein